MNEGGSASPRTNGWAERTLLNCLAVEGDGDVRSLAAGMQDVHGRLKQVARKPDAGAPDDESVYMTGNRAFHELSDKGLVENVEEAENLSSDRYAVSAGYAPDDGRLTEWVLTEAGFEEVRRLNEYFEQEREKLLRRFGRWETS